MMNTIVKPMIAAAGLFLAMTGCKIEDPDFFVPEVSILQTEETVTFDANGGTYTFDVEANCDWSVLCPADWVTLSASAGNLNSQITISISSSKLARNTTLTVYSNEVEAKQASFKITQNGVVEISSVSTPIASETETTDGTKATLRASYTGLSISETDVITAGFLITDAAGATAEHDATVDRVNSIIEVQLTGLTKDSEYTAVAWAQLNDMEKVTSQSMTFTPTSVPKAIVSVDAPEVTGARSDEGTTATLSGKYTAVSIESSDVISAGFILSTQSGESIPVPATVDKENGTFTAFAENLVTGTAYTCSAWVQLNDMPEVASTENTTFTPSISQPITIVADFSSNDLWQLPDSEKNMVAEEKTITDANNYTWTISGGCIKNGSLWLACNGKSGFGGYIILPQLKDMTVTSIDFPNDGTGKSGKARVTISVSTDNGNSFTPIPECEGVALGKFDLTNQKPGSIYKIENVIADGAIHENTSLMLSVKQV